MNNMDLNNMLMNTNLYASASDINTPATNKHSINISKLRNEVQHREDRKYKTFEKVLEMCYQKILSTNNLTPFFSAILMTNSGRFFN